MSRYRTNARGDDPLKVDGDGGFIGVNMRLHPKLLPPGYVSEAINARFADGVAEPRKGYVRLPWINKTQVVASVASTSPWGTVYGEGQFTVNGLEYILIAADGNVYAALENNFPVVVALPAGVTITTKVHFTQAGTTVYMWRGFDLEPLKCDDLYVGFTTVPSPDPLSGAERIPNGLRAITVGDRMWVHAADNVVWPSDDLDFESFDLLNKRAVESSPGDPLQTIIQFGSGILASIICLKRRSVHRLVNVVGDLTSLGVLTVTNRFGCVAPESAADWGSDLAWLSDEGVASLVLTEQGELQPSVRSGREPQRMLSDEIQPLIERINWAYAANAWGAFWNGNYYLAVPLDDAESFRPELLDGQAIYQGLASPFTFTLANWLVIGARYRYIRGSADTSISDGTTTLTADGEFVAASTTLTGISNAAVAEVCLDSLRRVYRGVNTAVLMYSTRNAAWAGYDTAEGLEVRLFFTALRRSRLRLFFAGEDGWSSLCEELFEDPSVVPYSDLSIDNVPTAGDTVQINGGDLITAAFSGSNTATNWRCFGTLPPTRSKFFDQSDDPTTAFSYSQQNVTPWSAPNTIPTVVTNTGAGLFRFYSRTGDAPIITITGTWGTVTMVTKQPVLMTLVTRAYKMTDDVAPGRLLRLALQVETWNPSYTIKALPEGVEESRTVVANVTRSRTRYFRPFDKADWLQTNVNNEFLTPYREDYSLVFTSDTMSLTLGDGIKLDQHQEYPHELRARGHGMTMRARIESAQGRTRVMAAHIDANTESRGMGITI